MYRAVLEFCVVLSCLRSLALVARTNVKISTGILYSYLVSCCPMSDLFGKQLAKQLLILLIIRDS